jgi:hypothetical protein
VEVNSSYHLLDDLNTTLLLPLEKMDESGSGTMDTLQPSSKEKRCGYSNFQKVIEKLKLIAYNCIDEIEFQNCCEPKFLLQDWLNSTIYPMKIPNRRARLAYCDQETDGGGWMVILRRGYKNRFRSKFDRSYRGFEVGFGILDRDFWMGLRSVHHFADGGVELLIELKRAGTIYHAHYDNFSLGDKSSKYTLNVGGYREDSTLPDSLSYSNGYPFTGDHPCRFKLSGAWWHKPSTDLRRGSRDKCSRVNLFTEMTTTCNSVFPEDPCNPSGPVWESGEKLLNYSYVEMKIRPKTWECGVPIHREHELKRAYLQP